MNRLLDKEIENYGLLKITDEGKAFFHKPHSFTITEDNDYEQTETDTETVQSDDAFDTTLVSILMDLRNIC